MCTSYVYAKIEGIIVEKMRAVAYISTSAREEDFCAGKGTDCPIKLAGVVVLVVVEAGDTAGVLVVDAIKFNVDPEHSSKFCRASVPIRRLHSVLWGSLQPPM